MISCTDLIDEVHLITTKVCVTSILSWYFQNYEIIFTIINRTITLTHCDFVISSIWYLENILISCKLLFNARKIYNIEHYDFANTYLIYIIKTDGETKIKYQSLSLLLYYNLKVTTKKFKDNYASRKRKPPFETSDLLENQFSPCFTWLCILS